MNRGLLTAAAAAVVLAASPALALELPKGGPADARVKSVAYDPAQVVRITGVVRTATEIVFSPGERIEHVALGDSSAWQVATARNILFLKPKTRAGRTDLLVTTDAGAATRSYAFELTARAAGRGPAPDFVLRFRYPGDARAQGAQAKAATAEALERRILDLKLLQGAIEGPRNLAYEVQGPADLQPSEVTDNGRFTVLRFPGAQAIPAVYTVGADGAEALASFDVRGEFVVVHGVYPGLRLRRGREVLCIYNDADRAAGAPTGAGTATAQARRTDRGARP